MYLLYGYTGFAIVNSKKLWLVFLIDLQFPGKIYFFNFEQQVIADLLGEKVSKVFQWMGRLCSLFLLSHIIPKFCRIVMMQKN